MSKKTLPKAIRRPAERKAAAGDDTPAPEESAASEPAPDSPKPTPSEPEPHEPARREPPSREPPRREPPASEPPRREPPGSEDRPREVTAPAARAPVRVEPSRADRWDRARAVVERHALYAAVGGLIPLPIVNVAGVTANIVHMVKQLSELYGVPFERDRARAMVVGLVGGTAPTGFATVTASTLMFVPGANLLSLAVSSATAIACTRGVGRVFIDHFESGASSLDLPALSER